MAKDENLPIAGDAFYAPPETVFRVLRDGGISESEIHVCLMSAWIYGGQAQQKQLTSSS